LIPFFVLFCPQSYQLIFRKFPVLFLNRRDLPEKRIAVWGNRYGFAVAKLPEILRHSSRCSLAQDDNGEGASARP
jgi:hypothetical protein